MESEKIMIQYLNALAKEENEKLTDKQVDKIISRILKRKSFPSYISYIHDFVRDEIYRD